jgi:GNAT superfamily N-acetyltransferase
MLLSMLLLDEEVSSVQGKAVCAAVFRVFGPQMAEVPLVATRLEARRQGHARVLMDAFENYFASLGVASICLPSAQETIVTWTEVAALLFLLTSF